MFCLCFTSVLPLYVAQGHPLVEAYVEYLRAFQPRLQAMVSLIEKAASAMGPRDPGELAQDFPHDEFSIEYPLVNIQKAMENGHRNS